jgi:hypothetical protein
MAREAGWQAKFVDSRRPSGSAKLTAYRSISFAFHPACIPLFIVSTPCLELPPRASMHTVADGALPRSRQLDLTLLSGESEPCSCYSPAEYLIHISKTPTISGYYSLFIVRNKLGHTVFHAEQDQGDFTVLSGRTFTRAGRHFMTGRMIRWRCGTVDAGRGVCDFWSYSITQHDGDMRCSLA